MEYTTLNTGTKIPMVGLGVYLIPAAETKTAVSEAIKAGYRLIDTAEYYHNEKEVGQAIAESGIPRDQFFITSKIPPQPSYEAAAKRIDESCAAIGNDYLDLMLIHWPGSANVENYRALEDAQKAGKVKAIGLSSFYGHDYQEMTSATLYRSWTKTKPMSSASRRPFSRFWKNTVPSWRLGHHWLPVPATFSNCPC